MFISDRVKLIISVAMIFLILYFMNRSSSSTVETMTEAVPNEGTVAGAVNAETASAPASAPAALPVVTADEIARMGSELDQYFASDLSTSQVGASFGDEFATLDTVGPLRKPSANKTNREETMARLEQENQEKMLKYNNIDLLPKEVNDQWFNTDFSMAEVVMDEKNLLNTDRYHIPINTIGSSRKAGGNHDLRPTIVNPKSDVGPWNNSTVDPDLNIRGW